MEPLLMDLHTHTIASGHAYGTITEMAKAAADKKVKVLGITEHAPGIPGTCDKLYFSNMKVVPRELFGVKLLLGSEINIMDYDGRLSLPDSYIKYLDIRIAGHHKICCEFGSMEENTRAVVSAMKNPKIDIISHPDDGRGPLDYEKLVEASVTYHTLLEINNNSLRLPIRKNAEENMRTILKLCMECGQPVVVNSDAHYMDDIANIDQVSRLIDEMGFPRELIMNYFPERFLDFLRENRMREGMEAC
ncbi:phosphatase [Clostridium sp. AM58-1XD]|uniref:phosphatase n=1 Tax=Clostridium sp. AM58-1XD TaxID=2292307 RepID=UPI000E46BB0D|nr:phosphatase [Clostridium sp. AM58-1XD]RGY97464.1 phosphatase [Clostridium sp. AM58-1XD]